ncbi:MAG: Trk system potassium transporter TrkA [Eubacterium sp.]
MLFSKEKTKGLNIIIVGCGKVGAAIVEQLAREGHDITVIDRDATKVQELSNQYDIMGVCGNGASFSVQIEAGIKDANLMIAVTDSDELNLLCCTVARRVSGCATIARVHNPDYSQDISYLREKLGLAMIINPELECAREMARILSLRTALEVNSFAHGSAELVKIRIPQDNMLHGMSVAELGKKIKMDVLICALERQKQIYIPSGDTVLQGGDVISFVAPRKQVGTFLKKIGFKTNRVTNVLILGGSDTAYYLAKILSNTSIGVKIVEPDRKRCEELCEELPNATIICGDLNDEDLLKEEGIQETEAVAPLTESDEENILLTLYARQMPNTKTITKINRSTFGDVIDGLDLGSVIYPNYLTSEAIIAYVRAKNASVASNIETMSHMFDNRVEAIEFRVDKESSVIDKSIMELSLKKDLLICFINRKGKIIIPSGQDCIMAGDTVMIVTKHTGFNDIKNILE